MLGGGLQDECWTHVASFLQRREQNCFARTCQKAKHIVYKKIGLLRWPTTLPQDLTTKALTAPNRRNVDMRIPLVSPNGKWMALIQGGGELVEVWDKAAGHVETRPLGGHRRLRYRLGPAAAFSPNGEYLIINVNDGMGILQKQILGLLFFKDAIQRC